MNWKIITLGEIIDLQNGYAFNSSEYTNNGYFLMRITNVQEGFIQNKNPKYITISHDSKLKNFILNEGDILMSLTGNVGRVGELKDVNLPAVLNQRVARIIIKSNLKVDKKYLFNLLNSDNLRDQIKSKGHGTAQLNVSTKDILSIKIFLPPLPIQQQIVEKLDVIFAQIDKATVMIEANAKNAEALFQSYLRENFKYDYSWKIVTLGDICNIIGGGTPSKSNPKFYIGDTLWATVGDMNSDYLIETDFKISKEAVKQSTTNIIPMNNVVIATRVGLGKVCIVKQDTAINQDLKGIIPKNERLLDVNYLFYFFKSISQVIINAGRGATVHGVKLPFIKSLKISLPPISVQKKIASKFNSISTKVNNLNKLFENKIDEIKLLKQSILQKAFKGELIKEP